jgi:type II secretory pathway component PulF
MITGIMYEYVAMDRQGTRRKGVTRAGSEADAFRQISATGLTPIKFKVVKERAAGRGGVRQKDIANFTYQLGVMIGARVPLSQSIRNIAEQEQPGRFRDILGQLASRIEAGSRIADAMQEFPEAFDSLYVDTIRAAEQSGNLVKVLEYLSEMLEREIETKATVRSALMYPVLTLFVLGAAVAFLIGFVIPKFSRMYAQKHLQLPAVTRVLVFLGESVQHYWWAYLIAIVALCFAVRSLWATQAGRRVMEAVLHRTPVFSSLLVGVSIARFARVFGVCINSGLQLTDALTMGGNASGRPALIKEVALLVEQVRRGGRLSVVLVKCTYLPPFARRMLISGEETSELARMCGVIAKHYERETSLIAKNMATLIEPVLIVLIAGVVLTVALGIFLPMWDMARLMN